MINQPPSLYSNKRFKRVSLILLGLSLFILLSCLTCYSPHANVYSLRSSLIFMVVIGTLLGGMVFTIGSLIAAFYLLPPELLRSYYAHATYQHSSPLRDEPCLMKQDQTYRPEEDHRNDWYDNPGNTASPLYIPPHRPDYSNHFPCSPLTSSSSRFSDSFPEG